MSEHIFPPPSLAPCPQEAPDAHAGAQVIPLAPRLSRSRRKERIAQAIAQGTYTPDLDGLASKLLGGALFEGQSPQD